MGADIIHSALVIETEDVSIKTDSSLIGGNWCLWSNRMLGEYVYFPAAGTYEAVVHADMAARWKGYGLTYPSRMMILL